MAKAENFSDDEFIPHVYKDALLKCLRAYSKEDSEEHGRLKELQRMLCDIDDRVGDFGSEDEDQWELNVVEQFRNKMKRKHSNTEELGMAYSVSEKIRKLQDRVCILFPLAATVHGVQP
jgi:hypothetical protein